jgi:hypothetical protein
MKSQDKPKVQKAGNMISRMNDFKNIHTGSAKTHPGVLKAKADKAKRDSILAEYKKKTVSSTTNKKKAPDMMLSNKANISESFVFKKPVTSKSKSDNTKVSKVAPKEIVMSKFLVKKKK